MNGAETRNTWTSSLAAGAGAHQLWMTQLVLFDIIEITKGDENTRCVCVWGGGQKERAGEGRDIYSKMSKTRYYPLTERTFCVGEEDATSQENESWKYERGVWPASPEEIGRGRQQGEEDKKETRTELAVF
ncbi:hypothetical protein RRG08_037854 [Elysia crispata]|uniref:Uncharacterized protein n=1 Tax=Elysia crispata TaxID=231223 RepID=A0AAE0ZKN5_9GAST|nr:hypothetical protein RRG08_037854 [Elysia crispata]